MSRHDIWDKVLTRISQSGDVTRQNYHLWLMPTSLGADGGEEIEVRVPDQEKAGYIARHYMPFIQAALASEGRANTIVKLVAGPPVTDRSTSGRRKGLQGRDVEFEATEPWPEVVDGAALLTELAQAFERFVILPAYASTALALWVLHSYTHEVEFCSPLIGLTSPVKQCGKTTVLKVLRTLVHRPLPVSNLTGSTLFRTIDAFEPTLLIDEADSWLPENEQVRGLMNSGHTRDLAWLLRNVGDDYLPRRFSTWCPKAIALIGRLPGTLEDRSIHLRMQRQRNGQRAQEFRPDLVPMWHLPLRRRAVRWAEDHVAAIPALDPAMPGGLQDRAKDCWRPLVKLADLAGGDWPQRARTAAEVLSGSAFNDHDQEPGVELLRDLFSLFNPLLNPDGAATLVPDATGMVTTEEIIAGIVALPERPWSTWRAEKPITPRALADLLRPLGVFGSGVRRIGDRLARGYRKEAFEDAFSRYLPIEVIKCCTPNVYAGKTPITLSFSEGEKIQSDQRNTPDSIGRTTLDHFETGKTGKRGVIPLIPTLKNQVARAQISPDRVASRLPSRALPRAQKGRSI